MGTKQKFVRVCKKERTETKQIKTKANKKVGMVAACHSVNNNHSVSYDAQKQLKKNKKNETKEKKTGRKKKRRVKNGGKQKKKEKKRKKRKKEKAGRRESSEYE
jgi:hypothetical protein